LLSRHLVACSLQRLGPKDPLVIADGMPIMVASVMLGHAQTLTMLEVHPNVLPERIGSRRRQWSAY
jgi:hypothetical protein